MAAALRVARRLGPGDLVVVLLPDSGRSYLSKVHSDVWMREWGFLEEPGETELRAALATAGPLVTVDADATVGEALEALRGAPGAVAPVVLPRAARPYGVAAAEVLGSVSRKVLQVAIANGDVKRDDPVRPLLGPALPTFGVGQPAAEARAALMAGGQAGVVVLVDGRAAGVLTRAALLR